MTKYTSINQVLMDTDPPASFDLDDIVHEAAASMASDANNGGAPGQVNFLKLVAGWSDKEILQALNDKLGSSQEEL